MTRIIQLLASMAANSGGLLMPKRFGQRKEPKAYKGTRMVTSSPEEIQRHNLAVDAAKRLKTRAKIESRSLSK